MQTSSRIKGDKLSYTAAYYGILGALSLVLNLIDGAISSALPLPAFSRPGLSNIVIMLAASRSIPGALYVLAVKVIFTFITRGATAALMSLSGSVLATAATLIILRLQKRKELFKSNVSYIGIGIISAALHNAGQLICSSILTGTNGLMKLLPLMCAVSVITGTITGGTLNLLMPSLLRRQLTVNS